MVNKIIFPTYTLGELCQKQFNRWLFSNMRDVLENDCYLNWI